MSDTGSIHSEREQYVLKVPAGNTVGMSPELYEFLQESGRLELFGEARVPGHGVVSDSR